MANTITLTNITTSVSLFLDYLLIETQVITSSV